MSFSSVARKIAGKKISNVFSMKNVVTVAPYAGAFTTSGRKELFNSPYAKYAGTVVGAFAGGTAGGATNRLVEIGQNYVNGNPPAPLLPPSSADAGGGGGSGGAFVDPAASGGRGLPVWAWVAIAGGGAVALLLVARLARKG